MVMFMGHFSSPRMGDTLVPYLKFLFLKTLLRMDDTLFYHVDLFFDGVFRFIALVLLIL